MRNLWQVSLHVVDSLAAGGTSDHLIAISCQLTFVFALFAIANSSMMLMGPFVFAR